jgi:electron transfer flavoprotein alpha subunit
MSSVLIIAEHRRGELRPVTLELVSAGQSARRAPSDTVAVALIAQSPESLVPGVSVAGVDEIVTVQVAARDFDPDTFETVTRALIEARKPSLVLVPHSIDTFGYAAALAARNRYGFATDVFRFEYQQDQLLATRGGYGQKVNVEVDFPGKDTVLLAVRGNVYKPPEAAGSPAAGAPKVSSFAAPPIRSRVRSREFIELAASDDVDMTAAEFILAIGRGIGEEANVEQFRKLADTIGATLGCSRPIADAGWLPKSRQIGQSGKTASACTLYVAMGISGAIQHLAGMKHVSTIVAVNADAGASIFSIARYGIVADIFEIAEALRGHWEKNH